MSPIRRIDDLRTHPRASFYLQSKDCFPACEIEDLYILHKGGCLIIWLVVCQYLIDILPAGPAEYMDEKIIRGRILICILLCKYTVILLFDCRESIKIILIFGSF